MGVFAAAREFGFEVVVAEYRRNALARDVSSFELGLSHTHKSARAALDRAARAEKLYCNRTKSLISKFEESKELYERGVRAAAMEGLKVIEFTFGAARHVEAS